MQTLTLTKPDDWHCHFRDQELLTETVAATARCFRRAIAMPNLVPPITTTEMALAYRQRLLAAVPEGVDFEPLVTLYLTNDTTAAEINRARGAGIIAAKLYPAGATTNSAAAVRQLEALYPVFETMAEQGMLLLVHGEVTDKDVDIFDREAVFIERHLQPLLNAMPGLKVVFEHITTREAVDFVLEGPENLAATITPQHLLLNRNDLLVGGIRPHNYCLPILKRNIHQQALRRAVASGSRKFFLGTDSAPHLRHRKESACGCAGCYSAWSALELYAQVFDELGALDKLEAFASFNGPDFYGLPRNKTTITLKKSPWRVPACIEVGEERLVPFWAEQEVNWQLQTE